MSPLTLGALVEGMPASSSLKLSEAERLIETKKRITAVGHVMCPIATDLRVLAASAYEVVSGIFPGTVA